MKKTIHLLILLLIVGLPSVAFGAKGAQTCGIGPKVLGGKGMVSQVLVQFTNVTLLPTNAVSVTVGTSGCGYSGIVQVDAPRLHYVRINYENLAEDAAKGEGTYISGFAQLMGCSQKAESLLTEKVQNNFADLFQEASEQPKSDHFFFSIKEEIQNDPMLASDCI
ncbi:MAG: DUF3015 family protein [Deltaproteobacteria bacterium]|jgi:hypothetical protein|nr:DUF3015 family protein [Deltaproteobacteria bacterium]MBT4091949.1 DUF3015 family protein [Deltaproteobacteria bacterium]MBT4262694.1 DUF3015 family protein [Deltaproteobacteria bacterium]MBT4643239.1 DUF3015 family protein [Deltaproteobacteria bacterium]MBT6503778.1 DUF3015 family protein [Deltaproteobacteria bacterium]